MMGRMSVERVVLFIMLVLCIFLEDSQAIEQQELQQFLEFEAQTFNVSIAQAQYLNQLIGDPGSICHHRHEHKLPPINADHN